MRGLVKMAVGATVMALLATQAIVGFAQNEEPTPFAPVTGSVIGQTAYTSGGGTREGAAQPDLHIEWEEGGVTYGEGIIIEQQVEWSDPRLPTEHWVWLDYTAYGNFEPSGVMAVRTSHLLVGADGDWRGTGRAFEMEDDRYSYYELVGDGAYEGLHAFLRGAPGKDAHGPWDWSYQGWVFEGEPQALPDPVEPATWEGFSMLPGPTTEDSPTDGPIALDPMAAAAFTYELEPLGEPECQAEAGREAGGVQGFAVQMRLTNDDGAWAGSGHGAFAFSEGIIAGSLSTLLTGEGGYEGLSLILNRTWDADSERQWGVVLPNELVPPMPEPVETAAE
jgi:hypothetical protein